MGTPPVVQYNPKPGEQIVPITEFSDENIAAIPFGSEVVIVNFAEQSAEAGMWRPEMVEQFNAHLTNLGREVLESALVLLQVPVLDDPTRIVHQVLKDWALSTDNKDNISIPPQTFIEILVDVAQRAQKQKKWEGD